MELVQQVAANLKVEAAKAEKGVGAILMALRMNVDPKTFAAVKDALPHSESLMGRALMSGARTGEMPSLGGPSGLLAALAAAGYTKDEIPRLGRPQGPPPGRGSGVLRPPRAAPPSRLPPGRGRVRCRSAPRP